MCITPCACRMQCSLSAPTGTTWIGGWGSSALGLRLREIDGLVDTARVRRVDYSGQCRGRGTGLLFAAAGRHLDRSRSYIAQAYVRPSPSPIAEKHFLSDETHQAPRSDASEPARTHAPFFHRLIDRMTPRQFPSHTNKTGTPMERFDC